MSVQAIGSQQAWAEFMKLAQVAQSRNPSLSRIQPQVGHQTRVDTLKQRFDVPAAFHQGLQAGSSLTTAEPKKYTKVLGNHFDAYA